jgi:protease IV
MMPALPAKEEETVHRLTQVLRVLLQIVGAITVLAIVLLAVAAVAAGVASTVAFGTGVRNHTVLTLDLEPPPVEYRGQDLLSQAMTGGARPTVKDIVDALERASGDDRVDGLVVTLGGESGGVAVAQEIRDAIRAFRDEGKFAVAYAETFGEGSAGNGAYYVASACDEIFMQPSGDIGLTGLTYETTFLKGTFEKLEIQPQFDQRYEYKNAMNTYTESAYTAPHEEALRAVMDSQFAQMVRGIAKGRDLGEEDVKALIDRGPFLGQEAVDADLVDGLAYRDEFRDRVDGMVDGSPRYIALADYLARAGRPNTRGDTIALIYGVGSVARGQSGYNPLLGEQTLGADSVAAAFRKAIDDDAVKAILFRVDSPGGSYVASDTIWRETVRAREAGKPVIVSMGNVAGSGGYFVSMAAQTIVAQPGTITGSIGVLGGKFVVRDFLADKLGITIDEVHSSDNGLMYSSYYPYSATEWSRHEAWLDRVYDDFTQKVADGRNMDLAEVQRIAKGRIWTGEDAKNLGLVDELGGFAVALRAAKRAADIDTNSEVNLKLYSGEPSVWDIIRGGEQARTPDVVRVLGSMAADIGTAVGEARTLGLLPTEPEPLVMPVVPVVR